MKTAAGANFIILITLILSSPMARSHGEDKPGPNGGFILMPGAFHTEVLPVGPDKAKIYLLDINWKNPSVSGSKLTARLGKNKEATCTVKDSRYFLCSFPRGTNLARKGKLIIKAEREGQVGNEAVYELPLKLQVIPDGHTGH